MYSHFVIKSNYELYNKTTAIILTTISHEPGLASSAHFFGSSSGREPLGISGTGFCGPDACPVNSVKALKVMLN